MVHYFFIFFYFSNCIKHVIFYSYVFSLEYIQPTYVNMHELASMAANKAQERNSQHNEPSSIVHLKVICCSFFHNKQQ